MPKMKTHKSAAKRYKVTATGKIVRRQAGIGHLLQHKSASRKRRIFKTISISDSHFKLISKSYRTRNILDRRQNNESKTW